MFVDDLMKAATRFAITATIGVSLMGLISSTSVSAQDNGDNWTGWHAGVHGGYRWTDADFLSAAYTATVAGFVTPFPARNENYDLDSPIVGLQLGYNKRRPNSNLMWGIVGDFDWGWGDDSVAAAGSVAVTVPTVDTINFQRSSEVEANWQATLRARLGLIDGPWLYYATAGIAWMDVDWKDSISGNSVIAVGTFAFNHSKNFTVVGVTLGAGVERELKNPKWRARLEYLYEHFDDSETVLHGAPASGQIGTLSIDDAQKIRIGLNRKFGRNN